MKKKIINVSIYRIHIKKIKKNKLKINKEYYPFFNNKKDVSIEQI